MRSNEVRICCIEDVRVAPVDKASAFLWNLIVPYYLGRIIFVVWNCVKAIKNAAVLGGKVPKYDQ